MHVRENSAWPLAGSPLASSASSYVSAAGTGVAGLADTGSFSAGKYQLVAGASGVARAPAAVATVVALESVVAGAATVLKAADALWPATHSENSPALTV